MPNQLTESTPQGAGWDDVEATLTVRGRQIPVRVRSLEFDARDGTVEVTLVGHGGRDFGAPGPDGATIELSSEYQRLFWAAANVSPLEQPSGTWDELGSTGGGVPIQGFLTESPRRVTRWEALAGEGSL